MASDKKSLWKVFKCRFPVIYTILLCIGFISVIYWQSTILKGVDNSNHNSFSSKECVTKMDQQRSNDYKFIRPLFLTDVLNESDDYTLLKKDISTYIEQKTNDGTLVSSGVYFRKMNDGSWFTLNANEGFHPGSLIKVPILIAYLKMAEYNPSLLNKEIPFNQQFTRLPEQTYTEKNIELGKKYTVKDLLYHMIVYSDNYATILLTNNINNDIFKKLFTDIGLPEPPVVDPDYRISAYQISKFLRLLYSSSYINDKNAEYALSLLSEAKFNDGFVAGLPPNTIVCHKFGEAGPLDMRELHETAIVYIGENTYLLTVFTKGKDIHSLANVLKDISALVYQKMAPGKSPS